MSSTSDAIDFTDHHGRDQDNGDGKLEKDEKDGTDYSTGHGPSKDPDISIFILHILALYSQTNMRYLINTLQ